ncbi:MAG: hypothetical protein F8N36_02565 [Desulfovibrio sp.]|uniref:hypothetical protein n=1 Tax=Desulfovibrio sp. TaxID=885 RepID=UPI00135F030C|nr:hypothetical protein [Desulfovibrio sp.]MTJ91735.1 hypothetical protein [Desulfovibrio sp.]
MTSAPSDLSTGTVGDLAPADDMSNAFASGMPNGGNSAPASASAPAPAAAEGSPDQQGQQVDPFAQRLHEHETSQRQQWQEQVNQWRREVTEDPHIGGANLPATVARAQLALDRFDDGKRIGQLLEQTGYGNNPDVLRFFNRLADALMEDGLVQGQAGGAMPPLEERMYAGWSSRNGRA